MIETILSANKEAVEQKSHAPHVDSNICRVRICCMDGQVDIDNDFDIDSSYAKFDMHVLGSAGCQLLSGRPANAAIEEYFAKILRSAEIRNQVVSFEIESHSHAPGDSSVECCAHGRNVSEALKTTYDLAVKLRALFPQTYVYRIHRYTNTTEGKLVLPSIMPEGVSLPGDQSQFDPPGFEEVLLNNTLGIARDKHRENVLSFTQVLQAFPRIGYNSLQCSYPIKSEHLKKLIGDSLGLIFAHYMNDYKNRSLYAVLHFDAAHGTYNYSSFDEARLALEHIKHVVRHERIAIKNLPRVSLGDLIDEGYVQLLWTVTSDASLETKQVVV